MKYSWSVCFASTTLLIITFGLSLQEGYSSPQPPGVVTEYDLQLEELRSLEEKPPPKKQQDEGIKYYHVMCSKDKVVVLKWTTNDLACVKEKTAVALEERGWGIPKDKTLFIAIECSSGFTIFYEGISPSETKILKTIRVSLSESDEYKYGEPNPYRWDHITIFPNTENSSFDLSITGITNENSGAKVIIESLKEIPTISDVRFKGAACF